MIWQDVVLLIVSLGFAYALIPQIIMNYKMKIINIYWTLVLISTLGLFTMGVVLLTLNLILTPIINVISSLLWAIILIQKIVYKKKEKNGKSKL